MRSMLVRIPFFPLFDGIREAINADSCLPSGLVSLFVIHLFDGTAPPLYTEFCGNDFEGGGRGGGGGAREDFSD